MARRQALQGTLHIMKPSRRIHRSRSAAVRTLAAVALPFALMARANADGTCAPVTGSSLTTTSGVSVGVGGQVCRGGEASLDIGSGATVGTTGATGAGAAVWVEGQGNTVTNTGTITRGSSSGNTFGLFLGDYSVARNNTTNAAATGTGLVGTTTLRITLSGPLAADDLTGKHIQMAGVIVDGEARPGDLRTIATATLVSGTTFDITVTGAGWSRDQGGNQFNLLAGEGSNELLNTGVILATYTGTATANVRAVETSIAGDYTIDNRGTIRATHTSIGTPQGIDAGGDVTSLSVVNSGLIEAVRTEAITLTQNTATGLRASSASIVANNLGQGAAVYSQEEPEAASIDNRSSGIIRGIGAFTPAIYLRAEEQEIVNAGVIEGSRQGSGPSFTYGMAIGSVSDSGEIRALTLTNSGTIRGDILAVNGNAYRWYALSNFATLNDRLAINSQWGQLDSTIDNSGIILGNLYFSNGTHVLTNRTGATLTGNLDIDQRDTTCAGCSTGSPGANTVQTSTGFTVVGTKDFSFENAGAFTGDITIRLASSTALGGTPVTSSVSLAPTLTGAGGASLDAPSTNAAGLGGTLSIFTASGAEEDEVTISPTTNPGVVIANQATWKLADGLRINGAAVAPGAATLPSVESPNSLVSWTLAVNNSNALVLQAQASTANIAGLSSSGRTVLDTLLSFNSTLGSTVQNLEGDAAVRRAAEQLYPTANGAQAQVASGMTGRFFQTIDGYLGATHLAQYRDAYRGATLLADASSGSSLSDAGRAGTSAALRVPGLATGEMENGLRAWAQLFGFKASQSDRNGVAGYDASASGFAFGADRGVDARTRAGLALGYGNSSISNSTATASQTWIGSYQFSLYGSRLLESGTYLNGAIGATQHGYDTSRVVLNNGISGRYNAWQFSGKVDAGWPMLRGNLTLIPTASLAVGQLKQPDYSETGVGALSIDGQTTNSIRSMLGGRMLLPLDGAAGDSTSLELRATWNHEFMDVTYDTTARFVAGGGAFLTPGLRPPRDSLGFGSTLRLASLRDGVTRGALLLSYDGEARSDYLSHALVVRFVLNL